jgi:hypothetical protein
MLSELSLNLDRIGSSVRFKTIPCLMRMIRYVLTTVTPSEMTEAQSANVESINFGSDRWRAQWLILRSLSRTDSGGVGLTYLLAGAGPGDLAEYRARHQPGAARIIEIE